MPRIVKKKSRRVQEVESFLPEGVLKALRQVDSSFDATKLLEAVLHHWGGFDKFAFDIVQEFKFAPNGSLTRQRILEMINRLTIFSTQSAGDAISFDDLDDEDLMAAAAQIVGQVAGNGQPERTDGEEVPGDPGRPAAAERPHALFEGEPEDLRQPEPRRDPRPAVKPAEKRPRGRPRGSTKRVPGSDAEGVE